VHRPVLEGRTPLTSAVARPIFGTEQVAEVTSMLSSWAEERLGAAISAVEQWHWSVGAVAIVGLSDGRRVALKAFPPRWTSEFLTAVVTVQRHLAARGLPCPVPLAGPFPLDAVGVMVCAESILGDPGWPLHPLGERELVASATGLARLVGLAEELAPAAVAALARHPMRTPEGELYPEPHSPLFDFGATGRDAGWIDDLARAALVARDGDTSTPVVAHTDWSARNVRLWPDGIRAIYDADSLSLVPESTAVGIAAATWSAFGDAGEQIAPSPEEAAAWARAYERAGRPLSGSQRHAAGGAVLHALAYTARCEHALEVGHPELGCPRRARDRLEPDGAEYIERFEEACEVRR
jgi:hypothetical protein